MEGWRKSSYSDGNGGNCVETASGNGMVMVRDTTSRQGGALMFPAGTWRAFMEQIRTEN